MNRVCPAPFTDAEQAWDDRLRFLDPGVDDVEAKLAAALVAGVGVTARKPGQAPGQPASDGGVQHSTLRQQRRQRFDPDRARRDQPVVLGQGAVALLDARHRRRRLPRVHG